MGGLPGLDLKGPPLSIEIGFEDQDFRPTTYKLADVGAALVANGHLPTSRPSGHPPCGASACWGDGHLVPPHPRARHGRRGSTRLENLRGHTLGGLEGKKDASEKSSGVTGSWRCSAAPLSCWSTRSYTGSATFSMAERSSLKRDFEGTQWMGNSPPESLPQEYR